MEEKKDCLGQEGSNSSMSAVIFDVKIRGVGNFYFQCWFSATKSLQTEIGEINVTIVSKIMGPVTTYIRAKKLSLNFKVEAKITNVKKE